jgi:hypothetical protein
MIYQILREEDFSPTHFLCNLFFEVVIFIPTIIIGAIILVVLPFVFLYIISFLLHRVYVTYRRELEMSSVVVMLLVVEPADDGTYQRVGTAEWEEDAFVACEPDIREIILA